jgi:hypothetical protein
MINHLATLLEEFLGFANRTRCFAHILNLVAKCIMHQFDTLKSKKRGVNDDLAAELDVVADEESDGDNDDLIAESDNEDEGRDEKDEDLTDARKEMTDEEIGKLEKSLKPVTLVLQKVRLADKHYKILGNKFIFVSFEKLRMQSKGQQHLFSLNGMLSLIGWLRPPRPRKLNHSQAT